MRIEVNPGTDRRNAACCPDHYHRAKVELVVEQAVAKHCIWEDNVDSKFKSSSEGWVQSEASTRMCKVVAAPYNPEIRKSAWQNWLNYATQDGNQEYIQQGEEKLALRQATEFMEYRRHAKNATLATAVVELWAVDRYHQELGLYNPFMTNEQVKAAILDAMQKETAEGNSEDRRQDLMDYEVKASPVSQSAHVKLIKILTAKAMEPAQDRLARWNINWRETARSTSQRLQPSATLVSSEAELTEVAEPTVQDAPNDAEYYSTDFTCTRKLCMIHMGADEIKALGTDAKKSKLAYIAVVQEVATATLNELHITLQLSDTGRRKLLYHTMYAAFGVLTNAKFSPERSGEELFATEQISIAARSNLLHNFTMIFINKARARNLEGETTKSSRKLSQPKSLAPPEASCRRCKESFTATNCRSMTKKSNISVLHAGH